MRGKGLIRDALARALFDAPPEVFEGFARTVTDRRPRGCNAPLVLARRICAELAHAGVALKCDRNHSAPTALQARLALEDHVMFGIEATQREHRTTLDAADRAVAMAAREAMTEKICEALAFARATLVRRRTRRADIP